VMMLLTLLISKKMIFGRNLSIPRVAGGGNEGCVVGTGVGPPWRQRTRLIRLGVSPPLRPPIVEFGSSVRQRL
jgi:hypothetical protein